LIKINHSNDLNRLFSKLSDQITLNRENLLSPIKIVIPVAGIKKWLLLKFADKFGVTPNIEFLYPNNFINNILEIHDETLTKSDILWIVADILKNESKDLKCINILKNRFANDIKDGKLYHLSYLISDIFEQYLLLRVDLIKKWSEGNICYPKFSHEEWQKELFLEVWRRSGKKIFTDFLSDFYSKKDRQIGSTYHFFAISNIPPIYFNIIEALSYRGSQIIFYFLNPSKDKMWHTDITEKSAEKISIKTGVDAEESLYFEKGNDLLISFGKLGKTFLKAISSITNDPEGESDFVENENSTQLTLLRKIQNDILLNISEIKQTKEVEQPSATENDDSLQIHSLYSEFREVEALYNYLLNLFNENPSLQAEDIAVMAVDINTYAPFISAIFGTKGKIPYTIADTLILEDDIVVKTFFSILDLRNSRFEFNRVFEIVEIPIVAQKFNLSLTDIQLLKEWFYETGIRWGIDSDFRKNFIKEVSDQNTWKFGIDRVTLSLIYESEEPFDNILPLPFISVANSDIISNFLIFLDMLFDLIKCKLIGSKPIKDWSKIFKDILKNFFDTDPKYLNSETILENCIKKLNSDNINIDIGADFVINYLKGELSSERATFNFLNRGVTFCEMIPMRSIPFQVISLLGMNDDKFPRRSRNIGLNIINQYPESGDRSIRDNDKYLFLETVISAKSKLYISYIGKDIKSNKEKNPSIFIDELRDYIKIRFGEEKSNKIIYHHPMNSTDTTYFTENSTFKSFFEEDFKAAQSCINRDRVNKSDTDENKFENFINTIQIPKQEETSLNDLITFFKNPVKFFLNRNLNIYFDNSSKTFEDTEPFELSPLDIYKTKTEIILSDKLKENIKMSGIIPHGNIGNAIIDKINFDVASIRNKIQDITNKGKLENLTGEVKSKNNFKVSVNLNNIYHGGMLFIFPKDSKKDIGKNLIEAWISHIFMLIIKKQLPDKSNYPSTTFLFFNDLTVWFNEIRNCEDIADRIINIFQNGMKNIIDFEINIGYSYIKKSKKNNSNKDTNIKNDWENHLENDEYYKFIYQEYKKEFNLEDFKEYSETLFNPLIDNENFL